MAFLIWNPQQTDPELYELLRTLAEEYPLTEGAENSNLSFKKSLDPEKLSITRKDDGWLVEYGRSCFAARGVAYALAGREGTETMSLKTHGILFDCTRGNVLKVVTFKIWLRRLALLGFNMAMIYVKDAYQVPGEPYFGYMRGAYSMDEIKAIDAYAKKLKIEMIGAIQALGHMEPILRWPIYNCIKDTDAELLVDEPKTYELLEKILAFWSEALSSRRIHLGMDETRRLGQGVFLKKHGYEPPYSIYNRHLNRVCEICKKHRFEPIIWSDMYFCYANKDRTYYSKETVVPEDVKKAIPKMVQLSYWDYYNRDQSMYESMLTRTSDLNGSTPFMASGVWTWSNVWTDYEQTRGTVRPCIDACRKVGAKELIYTMWGDGGGVCDFNSAWAGLAWSADYAFNGGEDHDRTASLYGAVCGTDYDRQLIAGDLAYTLPGPITSEWFWSKVNAEMMLWDDPIMGIYYNEIYSRPVEHLHEKLLESWSGVLTKLEPYRSDSKAGRINYAWCTANVVTRKLRLRKVLLQAYDDHDTETLRKIADETAPEIAAALKEWLTEFRTQWLDKYKPFGLELVQIRISGQIERFAELSREIRDYIDGKWETIPALENRITPAKHIIIGYKSVATGCFFL